MNLFYLKGRKKWIRPWSGFLWAVLIVIQYHLWFGEHSIRQLIHTKYAIEKQTLVNSSDKKRNNSMAKRIYYLQQHPDYVVESYAREDLSMIRPKEKLYFIKK